MNPSHFSPSGQNHPVTPLQWAIMLTVLYADMFDYTLQEDELYRDLIMKGSSRSDFQTTLCELKGLTLSQIGPYITWTGREILAVLRRQRTETGRELWKWADRYGRWLAWVPFVRMAAVSGSLAVGNASGDADIDFFIITEKKRLWIARFFLVFLRLLTGKLPRVFPVAVCPNYLLSLDALEVENRSLYTAHEIVQAVPLWGSAAYRQFIQANGWVKDYLPHLDPASAPFRPSPSQTPAPVRWVERLLQGLPGDLANALLFQLFTLYHRWVRSVWMAVKLEKHPAARPRFRQAYWQMIRNAFRLEKQSSINEGYAGIIRQRFARQVHTRTGHPVDPVELDRLFPSSQPEDRPFAGSLYTQEHHYRLFVENYGQLE
jgi:hypothetical protein